MKDRQYNSIRQWIYSLASQRYFWETHPPTQTRNFHFQFHYSKFVCWLGIWIKLESVRIQKPNGFGTQLWRVRNSITWRDSSFLHSVTFDLGHHLIHFHFIMGPSHPTSLEIGFHFPPWPCNLWNSEKSHMLFCN